MDALRSQLVSRISQVAFAIAVVVLLLTGYLLYRNTRELADSSVMVEHTYRVLYTQQRLTTRVVEVEAVQRGLLLSGDNKVAVLYESNKRRLADRLTELEALIADNPAQVERVARLRALIAERITTLDQDRANGLGLFNFGVIDNGLRQSERIREVADALAAEEERLLAERRAAYDRNYSQSVWGIAVSVAVALTTILLGFYFVNRDAAARKRIAADEASAAEAQKKAADDREAAAAEQERLARYNTLILNSTGEGIVGIDRQGKVTFANKAAGNLLGIAPPLTAIGRELIETGPPAARGCRRR